MGREVHVAIVTRGTPPRFDEAQVAEVTAEARAAHDLLGVAKSHLLEFPAAELDRVSHAELTGAIQKLVAAIAPDTHFLPLIGDVHVDHPLIFPLGMERSVVSREGIECCRRSSHRWRPPA